MKDEKPAKKMVPRDVTPWEPEVELAVVVPEPAPEATLPVGTHFDNLKKTRRAGKA